MIFFNLVKEKYAVLKEKYLNKIFSLSPPIILYFFLNNNNNILFTRLKTRE
jgi:hypothetical protein